MNVQWTVKTMIAWSTDFMKKHGIASPRLETELLLSHCLDTSRVRLYADYDKPLTTTELAGYKALLLERVKKRTPVAYILGHREFWSLDLTVDENVLIPRPDTECLVERALKCFNDKEKKMRVIDLCTGSGAIVLALASEAVTEGSEFYACDICPKALDVARKNAEKHAMSEKIRFFLCDLLDNENLKDFDLIVSNPPYIAKSEFADLSPEVLREPEKALLGGGPDGLDIIRRLSRQAFEKLNASGTCIVEIGYKQGEAAKKIFEDAGFCDVNIGKDYAQLDRYVVAVK